MYTRDTELRHLSPADTYKLAQILDPNNLWKKLMQIIPKSVQTNSADEIIHKYNNDHIRLVESASCKQNRMATEILLDEWGTSGRRRPTVGDLLELLIQAELFRAADLVAINFLNEPPPVRPSKGPAAKIDVSLPLDAEFINGVESILSELKCPNTATLLDNATASKLRDNNMDFYEKYRPCQKFTDIPQVGVNGSVEEDNVSAIDQYNEQSQRTQPHSEHLQSLASFIDSQAIPNLSELIPATENSEGRVSNHDEINDVPLSNTRESCRDVLPNLSALNVGEEDADDNRLKPPDEAAFHSSSSISSISSTSEEDDLSAPNLSLLDQRSSINDSSLTNVTSEENSFDMSMNEGSSSNDNIPCLSALK